ncbi:Protein of unknown function [Actinacidiphila glaucinigra]|uniref:DUF2637 domain-containing protein n=2 Tax=Actinacidiphila glaucinigra TaxID=235986 RepID=A0A239KA20_9ACTN|nr:Protein of unknown function [Actinacidiphila glaucinigra]
MSAIRMNRTHRILIGVVVTGAVVIAAIGFAGSYAAVRELALRKDFGWFANVFPIGIDAGIVVLLALDLLLTWLRIPFPLLRQTAWLLTAATIAFNGAAAWPDPLGVGMHGIIPILFVVSVEAARHAIGRVADITADKHMESVRLARWLLAPFATFRLWRRMKLWELRSYDEVIRVEQERLVYRARLRARYGRAWRRKAPVESLMPLKLARYGVPMEQTAAIGLAAAGIDLPSPAPAAALPAAQPAPAPDPGPEPEPEWQTPEQAPEPVAVEPQVQVEHRAPAPASAPAPEPVADPYQAPEPYQQPAPALEPVTAPVGAGNRRRALADGNGVIPTPRAEFAPEPEPDFYPEPESEPEPVTEDTSREEIYDRAFRAYHQQFGNFPNARQFGLILQDRYGISSPNGGPLSESTLRPYVRELRRRLELDGQYAS